MREVVVPNLERSQNLNLAIMFIVIALALMLGAFFVETIWATVCFVAASVWLLYVCVPVLRANTAPGAAFETSPEGVKVLTGEHKYYVPWDNVEAIVNVRTYKPDYDEITRSAGQHEGKDEEELYDFFLQVTVCDLDDIYFDDALSRWLYLFGCQFRRNAAKPNHNISLSTNSMKDRDGLLRAIQARWLNQYLGQSSTFTGKPIEG